MQVKAKWGTQASSTFWYEIFDLIHCLIFHQYQQLAKFRNILLKSRPSLLKAKLNDFNIFSVKENAYFSISIWFPLFQMVVWYLMISYAGETDKMRLVGFFPPCYLIISEFIMQFCQKLLDRGTKTGLSCLTDLVHCSCQT